MMTNADSAATADELLEQAAKLSGIDAEGAVAIRDGSHAIYGLPGGIVARIGKPAGYPTAQRELRISQWLNQSGIATVQAVESLPQPVVVDNRPVTWWRLIPDHRSSTPDELGTMLRTLHRLAPPTSFDLPSYEPFAGLREGIAAARRISEDNRSWLLQHHATLQRQYDELPEPTMPCVIHGDAWQDNLVVPPSGIPTVLDLDRISLGRRQWDLIQLAVDHIDFNRITDSEYRSFVTAYGGYDVTAWTGFRLLADIQELRWVGFAISRSDLTPAVGPEAGHRIACLRGFVPKPWRWTACRSRCADDGA